MKSLRTTSSKLSSLKGISTTITLPNVDSFKQKALYWANHFSVVCLLDSNNYPHPEYKSKEWVLAIDSTDEVCAGENAFEALKKFHARQAGTIFGFLGYDLKNQTAKLSSNNADGVKFPELYFFSPRYILEINGNKLTVNRNFPETAHLLEHIEQVHIPAPAHHRPMQLQARTRRQKYLQNTRQIIQQIGEGDFYEMNYCLEFYAQNPHIHPVETFLELNGKARAPFSSFFKLKDKYLLCASPERFLKKEGSKLISQPIKGTAAKGATPAENEAIKKQLQNDKKERAENIMIVDLVRNDLSRTSKDGSVQVEELCGVYEFNTVNQMISTITSEIKDHVHFTDAIKEAFPMGSMTGAPKIEVMKNIEAYEDFKRGLYSGAVGYITPGNNFDLNVVIRSIFLNTTEKYLSVCVGGAITHGSVPEKEYEEILLKAKGLLETLDATLET